MSAIRRFLDFLELKPVFTLRVVQVCWWLYVAEQLFRTHWGVYQVITGKGAASWQLNWLHAAFTPLRVLVALATIRLLLDVLLALLLPSDRRTARDGQALGGELLAFLDLRPFFTRWWLHVFWALYLLTFLYSLYLNTHIGSAWLATATPGDWMRLFQTLLEKMIWLFGVRLLIEVALKMQPPTENAPRQTGP
jgi:hypothetical protein